jgi:hypothetical protein
VIRPECPVDEFVAGNLRLLAEVADWDSVVRIKWVLNGAFSVQMNEDEIKLMVIRIKNRTL